METLGKSHGVGLVVALSVTALMAPTAHASSPATETLGTPAAQAPQAQYTGTPQVKTKKIKDIRRKKSSVVTLKVPKQYRGKRLRVLVYPSRLTNCVYGYECGGYTPKQRIKKWVRIKKKTVRFKLPIDFCKAPSTSYPYAINKADISYKVNGEYVGSLTPMTPNRVHSSASHLKGYPHFLKANGKVRKIRGC